MRDLLHGPGSTGRGHGIDLGLVNTLSHPHINDPFGLVLVIDAGEAKRHTRTLDHGLVAEHPFRMTLPRAVNRLTVLCERQAIHFVKVFSDLDWVPSVLSVDNALNPGRAT